MLVWFYCFNSVIDLSLHGLIIRQHQIASVVGCALSGDAWEELRTFVGILRAIATAMEKMVEGTSAAADPVVYSFARLANAYSLKHKAFNSAMSRRQGG